MARFGIVGEGRLGASIPQLRGLARELGRDHALALELWKSGIPDARILAGMLAEPARLTGATMDAWVRDFDSWDVCDQVCLNAFADSPLAWGKVASWARRRAEFGRRAAFALIACLATHDGESPDARFEALFPMISAAADDGRNYVKKAVSWALRGIGKRSPGLHVAALAAARELRGRDSKSARWIAGDAIRELESEAVRARIALRAGNASRTGARRTLRRPSRTR